MGEQVTKLMRLCCFDVFDFVLEFRRVRSEVTLFTFSFQEKSKKPENEKTVKGETEQPIIPFISMNLSSENGSPDPEYEEAADLASTIAKLRSLLQQKSSESNLSTPALSPM